MCLFSVYIGCFAKQTFSIQNHSQSFYFSCVKLVSGVGCSTESAVGFYELLFSCSCGLSRPKPDAVQNLPWAVTSYCFVVLMDFPDQNRMQYRICRGLLRATVSLFLWTFQTTTGCNTGSAVGCYELLFRCSYGLSRPQPDAIQDLPWAVMRYCFVVLVDFPDQNRMQYRICRELL